MQGAELLGLKRREAESASEVHSLREASQSRAEPSQGAARQGSAAEPMTAVAELVAESPVGVNLPDLSPRAGSPVGASPVAESVVEPTSVAAPAWVPEQGVSVALRMRGAASSAQQLVAVMMAAAKKGATAAQRERHSAARGAA